MKASIREAFLEASQQYSALKKFEQLLEEKNSFSALGMAYKAALKALYAKYALIPAFKLGYFLEANQLLNEAIEQKPENIEIRFIRFAIESSLPTAAHHYALHLREDKKMIVEQIGKSKLPKPFKQTIAQMLVHSGFCTFTDKQKLEKYLSE